MLATRQASDDKVYEVLHNDSEAHVVKINDSPREGETQYGYVFFDKSVRTPGPVRRVDKVNIYTMSQKITLIVEKFYLDTIKSIKRGIRPYKLRREAPRPTYGSAILLKKGPH